MNNLLFLFGLLPETIRLIREVVAAIRAGDDAAARKAAERAAIVEAFRLRQIAKRRRDV